MADNRQLTEITLVRQELDAMAQQFQYALPKHIPVERFMRVVMTAIQNNPELLRADRKSLWNSAMKAAQDGLLPDGRLGAMVVYSTKEGDQWIKKVQWLPMIAGIRQKVRNSDEIATWEVQVVHANDQFDYELGDNPYIRHVPTLEDQGDVIAAYSIATLKDGSKSREIMGVKDIEKVRAASKAKSGPWQDWYEEMCKKTVARRHSKVLPMSTDLDDLVRRDDELYDFENKEAAPPRPRLSDFTSSEGDAPMTEKPEKPTRKGKESKDGKSEETKPASKEAEPGDQATPERQEKPKKEVKQEVSPRSAGEITTTEQAEELGRYDRRRNRALKANPGEWRDGTPEHEAFILAREDGWRREDKALSEKGRS